MMDTMGDIMIPRVGGIFIYLLRRGYSAPPGHVCPIQSEFDPVLTAIIAINLYSFWLSFHQLGMMIPTKVSLKLKNDVTMAPW